MFVAQHDFAQPNGCGLQSLGSAAYPVTDSSYSGPLWPSLSCRILVFTIMCLFVVGHLLPECKSRKYLLHACTLWYGCSGVALSLEPGPRCVTVKCHVMGQHTFALLSNIGTTRYRNLAINCFLLI